MSCPTVQPNHHLAHVSSGMPWLRSSTRKRAKVTSSALASSKSVPAWQLLPRCTLPYARPELAQQLKPHYAEVGPWPEDPQQLPLVYHPNYNITLFGLEKLHPFDSCKFEKVVQGLQHHSIINSVQQLVRPSAVSQETLGRVHTQQYLKDLGTSSLKAAQVTELTPLALLPHALVDSRVLQPMRSHVGGTVLAAGLAVTRGWSINLGGGMHHAHRADGSGWCPYADITLAIQVVRAASGGAVQQVMVVDLDVHQGNGVGRDKLYWQDDNLCLVDMYNASIYPCDTPAKAGISVKVELGPGVCDEEYLQHLDRALAAAAQQMPQPHLIIYNAGTDILVGDPLGRLSVTAQGVVRRDAAVWAWAQRLQAPLVMLLSGGYTKASAGVIADSLAGLLQELATQQHARDSSAPPGSQAAAAAAGGDTAAKDPGV